MAATSSSTYLLCISYLLFAVCSLTIIVIDARSVPDGYVYTDQHRTAMKGDQLKLSCDFYGTPVGVFWKKGDNPEKSPDLITDVDGEPPSGSCLADQSCRLEADYTLIIDEVKVADRGTYICRVSNYRGVLIHNFTEVTVYAPPMEPFPVIKECPMKDSNDTRQTCSLSTSENVTITCSASGYYPHIDLFFLHGSQKMVTTNTKEFTNPDETRNKSISTLAEPDGNPYVCVASDIPGSQDQKTVSVQVNFPQEIVHSTIPSQIPVSGPGVAKVVVPVLIILLLVLFLVAYILRKKLKKLCTCMSKGDQEAMPLTAYQKQSSGKISFYELWYLVQNMDETDLKKLKSALIDLKVIRGSDGVPNRNKAYELLCEWKDINTSVDEGRRLYNTLSGYGFSGLWERMKELGKDEADAISDVRVDYIIRQIGNEKQLTGFLRELIPELQENKVKSMENKDEYVKEAIEEIVKWRELESNGSHFILLSLALERAKYQPLDRNFFKIPEHLLDFISPEQIKGFVYKLTGRHCKRLAKAHQIRDEKKIAAIINENNAELFDAIAMIGGWIAEQECSNYEKRCQLDDAVIKIGRHDLIDYFGTTRYRFKAGEVLEPPHLWSSSFNFDSIFDDDLAIMLKHLPSTAIPLFLQKLGISVRDEGSFAGKLQRWRDESIEENRAIPLQELCSLLTDFLQEMGYHKVQDVKDDELENILVCINSTTQMEKLMAKLDIENSEGQSNLQRLMDWRDKCPLSKRRQTLEEALNHIGLSGCTVEVLPLAHVYQVEMVRIAYNILCHDVQPLATLLSMDMRKVKTVHKPLKGTVGLLIQLLNESKGLIKYRRRDFSCALRDCGYLDAARSVYFGYGVSLSELYNITSLVSVDKMEKVIDLLEIDKQDLAKTDLRDSITIMKIWRNELRPEPIHYRLKLALALQAAGHTERFCDILAGQFRTTEICSEVVENIYLGLGRNEVEMLYKHLKLKNVQDKNAETTTRLVAEWVRNWLLKSNKMSLVKTFEQNDLVPKFMKGKDNDDLFKAGFFELAEEVMLLEVSKLLSDKPDGMDPEGMPNKDDAEVNSESAKKNGEAQSENEPNIKPNPAGRDHGDGTTGIQEPEESVGDPNKADENTQLLPTTSHGSSV